VTQSVQWPNYGLQHRHIVVWFLERAKDFLFSQAFTLAPRPARSRGQWVKGKVHTRTGHEGPKGEQMYSSFNLGARRGWLVNATPRPLYPRESADTHSVGGWVGPRAVMDECGKSPPPQDSAPRPYSPEQGAIPAGASPPPPSQWVPWAFWPELKPLRGVKRFPQFRLQPKLRIREAGYTSISLYAFMAQRQPFE